MNGISDRVGTAAMMRRMDKTAIEDYGIPGIVLMENAGRGAFEFLVEEFDPVRVAVFAGKGNNGGDGYVIARHLMNSGVHVDTYVLARLDDIGGDARTNLDILREMKAPVFEVLDRANLEDVRYHLAEVDLFVDAVLGTGITSEVAGFYREAIQFINAMVKEKPEISVLAVDLPSGVNADTGQVMGAAIEADATATFGMVKAGHLSFPGAALTGTLALIDISIPAELYRDVPHRMISSQLAAAIMPERPLDCHKGLVGHGLVIAGSPGKTGAAVMAAESALRAGAGLVTLAGPASIHGIFESKTLEVMTEPLPETGLGRLGPDSLARTMDLVAGKTAVALGPGIGEGGEVREFVRELIRSCPLPMVIDADGLNAVAGDVAMLDSAAGPLILTPHPGEMARLLDTDTAAVLSDRLEAALGFAREHKVHLVLKGAHTLVVGPEGQAFFNLSGNPGMATGGAGDVLTGAILGLVCQGLGPLEASVLGVFLHGLAGDMAAESLGEDGLIAGDIMAFLPRAFLETRRAGEE